MKKIGKLLVGMISIVVQVYATPTIEVTIKSMRGKPVRQVPVGQPFLCEITVSGKPQEVHDQMPVVQSSPGLRAQSRGSSTHMSSINGNAQLKYTYPFLVVADHAGTHRVGPARVEYDGRHLISDVATIEVVEEEAADQALADDRVFVEFVPQRTQAVAGERIPFTVRWCFTSDQVTWETMSSPQTSDCTFANVETPRRGSATDAQGNPYFFLEHCGDMIFDKPGTFTVPPFEAVYSRPAEDAHGFPGLFAMLRREQERVYSKSLRIVIDPLPASQQEIDGVGTFAAYKATLNKERADVGEGLVLTLAVTGDAVWQNVLHPTLRMSPDAARWYESNALLEDAADGKKTKKFEYILQPTRVGTLDIPAQEFLFYDTQQRALAKLTTEPLSIVVTSSRPLQEPASGAPQRQSTPSSGQQVTDLLPLDTDGRLYPHGWSGMPWRYFWMLMLLPLFAACGCMVYGLYRRHQRKHASYLKRKYAVKKALEALKQLEQGNNVQGLHALFVLFIASYCDVDEAEVTETAIEQRLRTHGCPESTLTEWSQFYGEITGYMFSLRGAGPGEANLYERSRTWIKVLEERL